MDILNHSTAWSQILIERSYLSSQQVISEEEVVRRRVSAVKKIVNALLTGMITIYQSVVSPVFGTQCRFYPSCSQYLLIAIERHGALRGLLFGARRLLRCNNFFDGGYDPVPEANGKNSASIYRAKIHLFSKE
jgi:hypothetical protein